MFVTPYLFCSFILFSVYISQLICYVTLLGFPSDLALFVSRRDSGFNSLTVITLTLSYVVVDVFVAGQQCFWSDLLVFF